MASASVDARFREEIQEARYVEATQTFCRLITAGSVPVKGAIRQAIGAAAPLSLVPSHQMTLPNGNMRSVNFDHTILGWRAAVTLGSVLPGAQRMLPLVQAMWYAPQGLDIWDQLHCDYPGHYAITEGCNQRNPGPDGDPNRFGGPAWRKPESFFEDPWAIYDGTPEERLDALGWCIAEGDREQSYGLFAGLAEDPQMRTRLEERVLFAGIIDIQDTLVNRRNYQNIGHKALRARSLVDIANYVGWENSRDVMYTVIPDLGSAPRMHGLWTEITGVVGVELGGGRGIPKRGVPLTARALDDLIDALLWGAPFDVNRMLVNLYKRGHGILDLADGIVIGYQRHLVDRAEHPSGFNELMHSFDYANVVNSWIRSYDSDHQVKGPFLTARFINDVVAYNNMFPRDPGVALDSPDLFRDWADGIETNRLLPELLTHILNQDTPRSVALVDSYLARTPERCDLIATITYAACHYQNDPHIMRNCASCIEEFHNNQLPWRDDILRGFVKFQARYVKRAKTFDAFNLHDKYFTGATS